MIKIDKNKKIDFSRVETQREIFGRKLDCVVNSFFPHKIHGSVDVCLQLMPLPQFVWLLVDPKLWSSQQT